MEISLFGSSEVYRSRPDVLGRSARGPARMFSDAAPGKGLNEGTSVNKPLNGHLWCSITKRSNSKPNTDIKSLNKMVY